MADIVYTTVNLPDAFLNQAYEAAVAYKAAASAVTAQAIVQTTVLNGLPDGLALDTFAAAPGSLRISGTPTGLASAGNTPKSGVGAYTFKVSCTDTAGAVVTGTLTINLYTSPQDKVMLGVHTTQDGLN